jgi:hypothetical protein
VAKDNKKSVIGMTMMSYVFTIAVSIIAYSYTINGFHLYDVSVTANELRNVVSILILILNWLGVFMFLCMSVLFTIVWIKKD